MSYQFVEVKLPNSGRIVGIGETATMDLGAINGNDATFLRVSVVVGAWATGPVDLSLEHSHDGGVTWVVAPSLLTTPITATGTWTVETTPATGPLSPNVRLVVASSGGAIGITKILKTFSPGPMTITAASSGGQASEVTLLQVLSKVTDIEVDTSALVTSSGNIEADVATIQTDTALIKTSVGNIETDVATIQTDTALIKTSVGNIETDVGTIQTDTALIKTDVGTITTKITSIDTKTPALGQAAAAASVPVVLASDQSPVNTKATRAVAEPAVVRDYSSANISDAAWTQIVASTAQAITLLKIFDGSGQVIRVATGAAASETDLIRIPPGGDNFEISIPAGTRLSIRAEAGLGTINTGTLVFQMFT